MTRAHWSRKAGKVALLQSGNTLSAGVCKEGSTCRVPGATALKTDGTSLLMSLSLGKPVKEIGVSLRLYPASPASGILG